MVIFGELMMIVGDVMRKMMVLEFVYIVLFYVFYGVRNDID